MAYLAHNKSVCLTPPWVIAKAVEVAAETSLNSYDIKNRAVVFPVRCSATHTQSENHLEQKLYQLRQVFCFVFLSVGSKSHVVRQVNGSSKSLCRSRREMHLFLTVPHRPCSTAPASPAAWSNSSVGRSPRTARLPSSCSWQRFQ